MTFERVRDRGLGPDGAHLIFVLVEGPAIVFDSEEEMIEALKRGEIKGGHVVVIRYEGPKGGPGMPEMRNFPLLCVN